MAGPPPLPPAADAKGLKDADKKAGAAGGGHAGGGPAACNWELLVKIHSQEKFWPKQPFDVTLSKVAGGKLGATVQTKSVTMVAKDAPDAQFKGEGNRHYAVGTVFKKEPGWIVTEGEKSSTPAAKPPEIDLQCGKVGAKAHKMDLYVRLPLKMYLKLGFLPPGETDKVVTFPKDFPVEAYGDAGGSAGKGKTDEHGQVMLEVDRKFDWVSLKFGADKQVITNKDGKQPTSELKDWAELKNLFKTDASYWSPPAPFTM